ncbi:MAG: alpha/beta hydrolase fold domain-containing protein, partial [Actinomycetota bacterium]
LLAGLPGSVFDAAMVSSVDDTITAIDYLRTHAREFGLDVDRLGLVGGSAGAITADHIAYVLDDHGISGPRVRFVASLWGGILIPAPTGHGDVAAAQLNHGEAALFAVHGDHDSSVRVALDDELVARATAEHVPVEYERIAGGEHSFEGTQFFTRPVVGPQTAFDRLLAFAAAHLR